jgi:uncharacterized surface protein with fasciclin (FAS1) repeats
VSDRGPYGADPDPTEAFPPLGDDPTPTPPADLPPIGSDPDPTRVMAPTQGDVPTTAMPAPGGPYDGGPPYGGPPGGGGGDGEPPYEPDPVPWYRQPGPLAALIAGIAALIVAIIALIVWTGDDDDRISGETLPSIATSSSTTTSSVPDTTTTTSSTLPATTTTTTTTTSTTTTTTTAPTTTTTAPPTTTTTLPPTTTAAPTTTVAPTTPPTTPPPLPVVTIPAGQSIWDGIANNDDLSILQAALECTGLDEDIKTGAIATVLSPPNAAFEAAGLDDPCASLTVTEPILLLHLISVDMTAEDIFGSPKLQTEGAELDVDGPAQTIGTNGTQIIVRNVRGVGGFLQVIDRIVQG